MQRIRQEDWHYALLLVVLFAISALATRAAIEYISPFVGGNDRIVVTLILCALTLGMMLISAAFALWFIKTGTRTITARNISDIVNTMSYIKDGVLAANRKGRIIGMNPAARQLLSPKSNQRATLAEICPALTESQLNQLLKSTNTEEVECDFFTNSKKYRLRIRSQKSKSATLLLINDVTDLARTQAQRKHAAYLQLIGHISQGIANDFNNILCGISGHASLIMRPGADTALIRQSAAAINDSAGRGIQLVGSLLGLSNSSDTPASSPALSPAEHVKNAVNAISANLHSSWQIISDINPATPPTALTGRQIEHIIQGIGMLADDEHIQNRKLFIQLSPPSDAGIYHTTDNSSGIIIITPSDLNITKQDTLKKCPTESSGTIQTVVDSILKQYNGQFECFRTTSGIPLYRICLPPAPPEKLLDIQERLPPGLEAYIAGWQVMVCRKNSKNKKQLLQYFDSCHVRTEATAGIVELLAHIENKPNLHAIIVNSAELGSDKDGLLRAIAKLCPNVGILVLDPNTNQDELNESEIITVPESYPPAKIAQAMIEARTRARAKHKSQPQQ